MKTARTILCCVALAGRLSLGVEPKPQGLPTWPQSFALGSGEHATFVVPVTAAGAVTAKAAWEGAPLSLTLTDLQGKTLANVESKPSPATLTYTITTADLARGPLYCLVLSTTGTPKPSPNGKAKGTVTVSSPEIDPAVLAKAFSALQQQRAGEQKALESKTPSVTRAVTVNKPRLARIAEQDRALLAKFKVLASAPSPSRLAVTPVLSPEKTAPQIPTKPITPKVPGPGPKGSVKPLDTTPTILSITPRAGSFDDRVTLTCVCLSDPAKCDVLFTAGTSGTGIRATPAAQPVVDESSGEQQLTVMVPKVLSMTAPGTVTVTVVDQGRTPSQTSKPVNFFYDPTAPPVITSISPTTVKQEDQIRVTGKRFQQGDRGHLIIAGQGDSESQSTLCRATTTVDVSCPPYWVSEPVAAQFYILNKANQRTEPVPVALTPNQCAVTRIEPAEAEPGESVLMTGKLLAGVKYIHARLQPRDKQTAKYIGFADLTSPKIEQSSDDALLVRIPADWRGFSGPIAVNLGINGVGKEVIVPLTVKPVYVKARFQAAPDQTTNTVQQGEASDGATHPVAVPGWQGSKGKPSGGRGKPPATVEPPGWWCGAMHRSSLFAGHKGDDTFSAKQWMVSKDYNATFDSATIEVRRATTAPIWEAAADAKITSAGPTSDGRPTVTVHWWVDAPERLLHYEVSYFIRCPKGAPMAIGSTQSSAVMLAEGEAIVEE